MKKSEQELESLVEMSRNWMGFTALVLLCNIPLTSGLGSSDLSIITNNGNTKIKQYGDVAKGYALPATKNEGGNLHTPPSKKENQDRTEALLSEGLATSKE